MRRTFLPLLSAVAVFVFVPGIRAADDDVKAILTKALKAHGGEEKAMKYKAAQTKSKGKISITGAREFEFTQEVSSMQPNKVKDVLELSASGKKVLTRVLWFNGDKLTLEQNGEEVKLDDDKAKEVKELLREASYMSRVVRLVPLLKEKGFELSLVGDDKVEGKPVVGVLVKSKGHKDITLYFNKETGLLAKMQHRVKKEGTENEVSEERIILEYMKKDDVPVAKKVLVKHDGEKYLEAEVTEVKYLEKLDDSEFAK